MSQALSRKAREEINMSRKLAIRIAAMAGLCLALTGCADIEEEMKLYIAQHRLSESKALAFRVCINNLSRPMFPVAEGNLVMKSVPLEVCGCQVPAITALFKDKQYGGYAGFATYMARENKKKKPKFGKKVLSESYTSPEAAEKLEEALNSCVKDYREAHVEESAELFEVVPLKPVVKKGEKDKKTETAGS